MLLPAESQAAPISALQKTDMSVTGTTVSGRVTDSAGKGLAGVTVRAIPTTCENATAEHPVLLITGWSGSEDKKSYGQDENFRELSSLFEKNGYIENCNLFYVSGLALQFTQSQNAKIIQEEICRDRLIYQQQYASKNPIFNIIAHSYGGLLARAYLESDLYIEDCRLSTDNTHRVTVENLITLGTPHAGEIGNLPLSAFVMSFSSLRNKLGLQEILPAVRLWQNLNSRQPTGVKYYLIGGDARAQSPNYSTVFDFLYSHWP